MHLPGNILSFLSLPENRHYLDRFRRRSYNEKNIVCEPETEENGVFFVTSGRLRVYLSCEGREFTLLFLNPGDVFSFHSGAIVEAKQSSEILLTDLAGFEEILLRFPHISISAMSTLGKVLSNSTRIIEDLMFRDVRSRLLRYVIELTEEKGSPVQGGTEVPFDLNTEEVAMMIGSTRQSTSSLFNELIKDGHLVRLNRRLILVPDLQALKRMQNASPRRSTVQPCRTVSED
jgi:CRP-like cAMP-binding protein